MRPFLRPAALALLLCAGQAHADGKIYVPLPSMTSVAEDPDAARDFLAEMYITLVINSNCFGASLSDPEHSLLTDSFDLLAYGEMAMSTDDIVETFEKPAFAYLDNAEANPCGAATERKEAVLSRLIGLGGSLTPLPDQEKAYAEWRVLMDSIRP